jgi:hypothetical protein
MKERIAAVLALATLSSGQALSAAPVSETDTELSKE